MAQPRDGIHVATSLAADADASNIELFIGGELFGPLHHAAGQKMKRGHACAGDAEELTLVIKWDWCWLIRCWD